MTEYRDKRLDTLSKGNQQKIQLVATLIADPDIIILDEPFSGLDPVNAMLLKDLVRELIAKGRIVLFFQPPDELHRRVLRRYCYFERRQDCAFRRHRGN